MLPFKPVGDHNWNHVIAVVGIIPAFLDEDNPKSAKEQIADQYISGWSPFKGFKFDPETRILTYPDDPPLHPVAEGKLRDETILVYRYGWTLILQPDGSWEVARLD